MLSPLRKLETLYLTIWTVDPTADWLETTHFLRSTIPTLRTVHLDVQADLRMGTQRETKRYFEKAASCITHLEDILLAMAVSGSLNRVILSLTDHNSAMKRPFRETVIFHFGKIFPRLRKQGILECIRLSKVCRIQLTSLVYKLFIRLTSGPAVGLDFSPQQHVAGPHRDATQALMSRNTLRHGRRLLDISHTVYTLHCLQMEVSLLPKSLILGSGYRNSIPRFCDVRLRSKLRSQSIMSPSQGCLFN